MIYGRFYQKYDTSKNLVKSLNLVKIVQFLNNNFQNIQGKKVIFLPLFFLI